MSSYLTGLYPFQGSLHAVTLFGYKSKGLPGLEIIGLGKQGRGIKEKFIYLGRREKLKMPLRRYVLCVEEGDPPTGVTQESYRWLEFPLFVLFWSLAEQIPIQKLDDCFSSGLVLPSGEIRPIAFDTRFFEDTRKVITTNGRSKVIAPYESDIPPDFYHLPAESLFTAKQVVHFK